VLIEDNDVAGNYWGRGIALVGGKDITIRRNKIAYTTVAAGILVTGESSWNTSNVHNVLVEDNDIAHVQTTDAQYNPINAKGKTGQGAIDIDGQSTLTVTDVIARNNRIQDSRIAIFLRGNSCQIGMQGNVMNQIGVDAIRVDSPIVEGCSWSCVSNQRDGQPTSNVKCDGVMPTVTGAGI
jgi:hypothetical protein